MDHFPYWVPPASVSPTVGVPCVPQAMLGIVTSFFTAVGKMPPCHTHRRDCGGLGRLGLLQGVNNGSLVSHFVSMVSGLWSLACEQGTMTVILASASVSQRGQWSSSL